MRWAIVIGIDNYGGEVPNLIAAVRDAGYSRFSIFGPTQSVLEVVTRRPGA